MAAQQTFAAKTIHLKGSLDEGLPELEHFEIRDSEVSAADLQDGDIILKALVLSADPYLRGAIRSTGYIKAGAPMVGFLAGKVLASRNAAWAEGDFLGSNLPFSTVQRVSAKSLEGNSWKLTGLVTEQTISHGVGVLGMPGATAYGGLLDVLRPKAGETIFVSAASGAVGALVGQLAKNVVGCKTIASVGGPKKVELAKKLGYDVAIDYKQIPDAAALIAELKKATDGEGIDMYFENVGGMHFEASAACLKRGGRIALCGFISQYNKAKPEELKMPSGMDLIYKSLRIEGFLCAPWLSGKQGNFLQDMAKYLQEGKVSVQESFTDGIENWPTAFRTLFTGENVGKVVVRV